MRPPYRCKRATTPGKSSVSMTKASSSMTSTRRRTSPTTSARFTRQAPRRNSSTAASEIIRPVQQHGMGLGQALPDMLGHAQAQTPFDLAAFQLFAQFFHGRDAELLVDALDALGIEPRIVVDARDLGRGLRPQGFQLPQAAGPNDLPDGGGDGVADARILRQVGVVLDEFLEAFRHVPELRGRPLIGFDLVRIFLLGRQELRKARQPVRNLGIAEKRRAVSVFPHHSGLAMMPPGSGRAPSCVVDFSAMRLLKTEGRRTRTTLASAIAPMCSSACLCSRAVRAVQQSRGTMIFMLRMFASCAVQRMQLLVARPERMMEEAPSSRSSKSSGRLIKSRMHGLQDEIIFIIGPELFDEVSGPAPPVSGNIGSASDISDRHWPKLSLT